MRQQYSAHRRKLHRLPEVCHQKVGPLCLQCSEPNGLQTLLQVAALALQGAAQLPAHRVQQCSICAGHPQQCSGRGTTFSNELPTASPRPCSARVPSLYMLSNGRLGPLHCQAVEQPRLHLQSHACVGALQAAGPQLPGRAHLKNPCSCSKPCATACCRFEGTVNTRNMCALATAPTKRWGPVTQPTCSSCLCCRTMLGDLPWSAPCSRPVYHTACAVCSLCLCQQQHLRARGGSSKHTCGQHSSRRQRHATGTCGPAHSSALAPSNQL